MQNSVTVVFVIVVAVVYSFELKLMGKPHRLTRALLDYIVGPAGYPTVGQR